jgi:hypothetical protein
MERDSAGRDSGRSDLGAFGAARELLRAGVAILGAFARLLGVLVQTLPHVMLAGVIALGGAGLINHLDNSLVQLPTWLQASAQNSPPQDHQAPQDHKAKAASH